LEKLISYILSIWEDFIWGMRYNGLCKWSAGIKVGNFQLRTEPIRLFIFSFFTPIVKDELAVLQRRTAVEILAETRITFTFCYQP
jgi:hypothetical protein